jgi:hypothetical protein
MTDSLRAVAVKGRARNAPASPPLTVAGAASLAPNCWHEPLEAGRDFSVRIPRGKLPFRLRVQYSGKPTGRHAFSARRAHWIGCNFPVVS